MPVLVHSSCTVHGLQFAKNTNNSEPVTNNQPGFTFLQSKKAKPLLQFKNSGFTLVELLVAISILAVLFGVVITSSQAIQKNTRDAQRKSDLRNLQSILQQYYADADFYPDDNASSGLSLTSSGSITSATGNPSPPSGAKTYLLSLPKDPIASTQTPYCYKAYVSLADKTTDCNNSTSKCFYYSLFANLETESSGSLSCGGKTYNFEINPSI